MKFDSALEEAIFKNLNDPLWKRAGLHIPPYITRNIKVTEEELRKWIGQNDMVVGFLVKHSDEPDFRKKYFHAPNQVRFFKVLALAEKEAA